MRALVISGGGSKGAFAGGVAQYLLQEEGRKYDMFLGTSTGSLLVCHLALNDVSKIHDIFTNVGPNDIFSVSPFVQRKKGNREFVSIDFVNSIWQFMKLKRTFGESKALKRNIRRNITKKEFTTLKESQKDIIVTVTNLSKNRVEYKSINECSYEEFCHWIWISCNYIPFMSLAEVDGFEYADGGLGCVVPIREAILRGATEVDAIVLKSESLDHLKVLGRNPFSLMMNIFGHLMDQVERNDVVIGKLAAKNNNVDLNLYYTPTRLTENSLIFSKRLMVKWWKEGFDYAKKKHQASPSNELKD